MNDITAVTLDPRRSTQLRHFTALHGVLVSSIIVRRDDLLGRNIRNLERHVHCLLEIFHLEARVSGYRMDDFNCNDTIGRKHKESS